MQEIKFRAFDTRTKHFINLCREPEYCYDGYYFISPENGAVVEVFNDQSDTYPSICEEEFEVTQYSGVKDSNGKEIYEGDIIKKPNGEIEAVIFCDGVFCVKNKNHPLWRIANNCEVIGNIYKNADLLE